VAVILKDFPHFRSAFDPNTGRVTVTDAVHLGIALSPGENLYTPVIHHADRKSLEALEAAVRELSAKAEQGRFKAEELEGATFTISNLGMYPVRAFVAIIPPGHAAALAIGAVEEHYVVRDGQPVIAPLVSVTLSVDHRLINGREAGEFLARLKGQMETL
jgi:pyruvate dehydrogenase E2 component (dihydrolipoamide acetyltransferase)